jgi:hypothetical protein
LPVEVMEKLPPVSLAAPAPEPKKAPAIGPLAPAGIALGPPGEPPVVAVPV